MKIPPSLQSGSRIVRYFLIGLFFGGGALSFGIVLFTPGRYHDYVALATGLVFLIFFALPIAFLRYWYGGFSPLTFMQRVWACLWTISFALLVAQTFMPTPEREYAGTALFVVFGGGVVFTLVYNKLKYGRWIHGP